MKQIESSSSKVIPFTKSQIIQPIESLPEILDALKEPQREIGPIEQQMREKLSKLKDSKYSDTFDWSVYDQIAKRYGDEQPRGGVVFKTNFKLVNYHTSCNKCHYAFEIDTYGRGCIHDCVYCYAKDQLTTHGFWNRPMPFPVDISEVRKIMYTVFETDKQSKWRSIMNQRIPVRIGSMSDSFMHMDKKYKVTQELLKILNYYKYPHIIFTRSDLVADDQYMKLMDKNLVSVQFSISGNNDYLIRRLEPGAPSSQRRFAALKKLNQAGFWTTVRVNPLFPRYPDGYYSDHRSINERFGSKENVPVLDLINEEFIPQLKDAGVPSLLAGFVRLSRTAINQMSKAIDIDLATFFKPEFLQSRGDKRYSDAEIATYYMLMKTECAKNGIRFNTCYIGNGEKDYYQYQDLWDNKGDCCDARGNVRGFELTSQVVPWDERIKHSTMKCVAEESMKQDYEMRKVYSEVITKHKDKQLPLPEIPLG